MKRFAVLASISGLVAAVVFGASAFASAGSAPTAAPSPARAPAAMGNRTACVAVVHTARGQNCSSSGSLEVRVENRCGDMINMSLCLQRENGTWSCFSESRATYGASAVGHVCNAGNQGYRYRGCDVGERCRADE